MSVFRDIYIYIVHVTTGDLTKCSKMMNSGWEKNESEN